MGIDLESVRRDEGIGALRPRDGKQRTAVEYAREMAKMAGHVTPGMFARLKHYYNDAEIVEITLVVGLITMLNLFNNALDVK